MTPSSSSKQLINFLRGWPSSRLLPARRFRVAAESCLTNPDIYVPGLLYGPDPGYEPLREQIAKWLTAFYKSSEPLGPQRICITGGASQNLACLLQVFTDPLYTHVWMVAPTYFLACRIFEDNGFAGRLRAVPEDEEGIDIDYLEREIEKCVDKNRSQSVTLSHPTIKPVRPWSKIYRHVIYAVPTFSNPSSKTMSLLRRQQLVRLARKHDALVITDDVYDQLQWPVTDSPNVPVTSEAILPRVVDVDRVLDGGALREGADGFGNAVSNGSFSKILGPGCRTGWAEGTEKLAWGISQTGSSRSGGAPSQLTATIVCEILKSGAMMEHVLGTLQPAYASRYRRMMAAIEEHLLPLGVTLPKSGGSVIGGYFIWISLPESLNADEVSTVAKEKESLIVAPGSLFVVAGDARQEKFERDIRLCFSWEDEEKLEEGIVRLATVIRNMRDNVWSVQSDGRSRHLDGYS